jgi:hypothetical protein
VHGGSVEWGDGEGGRFDGLGAHLEFGDAAVESFGRFSVEAPEVGNAGTAGWCRTAKSGLGGRG